MGTEDKTPHEELLGTISKIWLLIKRRAKRRLRELEYDLTFEQVIALHVLEKEEGLNVGEVAERADRERTTMSRMIDGLEKRNLVVRVPDKTDRRHKLLYLTSLGKERVLQIRSMRTGLDKVIYAGIDQTEVEKTLATMSKIMENLEYE